MIGHAKYLATGLQTKIRLAGFDVSISARDGETLLITGGTVESNLGATRWLHRRMCELAGSATRGVFADGSTLAWTYDHEPQRAVTWARAAVLKAPVPALAVEVAS